MSQHKFIFVGAKDAGKRTLERRLSGLPVVHPFQQDMLYSKTKYESYFDLASKQVSIIVPRGFTDIDEGLTDTLACANIIVFVISTTAKGQIDELLKYNETISSEHAAKPLFLVATKIDEERQVSNEDLNDLAKRLNCQDHGQLNVEGDLEPIQNLFKSFMEKADPFLEKIAAQKAAKEAASSKSAEEADDKAKTNDKKNDPFETSEDVKALLDAFETESLNADEHIKLAGKVKSQFPYDFQVQYLAALVIGQLRGNVAKQLKAALEVAAEYPPPEDRLDTIKEAAKKLFSDAKNNKSKAEAQLQANHVLTRVYKGYWDKFSKSSSDDDSDEDLKAQKIEGKKAAMKQFQTDIFSEFETPFIKEIQKHVLTRDWSALSELFEVIPFAQVSSFEFIRDFLAGSVEDAATGFADYVKKLGNEKDPYLSKDSGIILVAFVLLAALKLHGVEDIKEHALYALVSTEIDKYTSKADEDIKQGEIEAAVTGMVYVQLKLINGATADELDALVGIILKFIENNGNSLRPPQTKFKRFIAENFLLALCIKNMESSDFEQIAPKSFALWKDSIAPVFMKMVSIYAYPPDDEVFDDL